MIYKDSSKPVEQRVEDLLGRMTVEEKVAQLWCKIPSWADEASMQADLQNGLGTLCYLNMVLTGDNQRDMARLHDIQRYLVEGTRLGIPVLAHSEGIAGAQIPGATTFPQSLGLAATWQPGLARRVGEVVKNQLAAYGLRAVHSPLFDLGRDPRWGRIGETYGEDPYLVAQMGVAFVQGVQGENEVMATAKHFIGYGNAEGGRNGGEMQLGQRKLLDTYCFPFEAAIHDGKLGAVMNAYGVLNDEPVATSRYLLTDLLRGKLGFTGPVVADYGSINRAEGRYGTAATPLEAGIQALEAGIDVEQPNAICYKDFADAIQSGRLDIATVDQAVRRVLEMKFRLGLFENPYAVGNFEQETASNAAAALSLEAAEKSIVLAQNDGGILPLEKGHRVALVGPLADDSSPLFGGYSSVGSANTTSRDFNRSEDDAYIKMAYTAMITDYKEMTQKHLGIQFEDEPSPEQKVLILASLRERQAQSNTVYGSVEEFLQRYYPGCKTVREALAALLGQENLLYARGCGINTPLEGGIEAAVAAAQKADIVVAVLGGRESMRAEDATCGENKDNCNIGLQPPQQALLKALLATGKPVVVVVAEGRALSVPALADAGGALLYAWLPAQEGAQAIANVLTGQAQPGGRLPLTVARHAGQVPLYYGHLPLFTEQDEYAECIHAGDNRPLYPFGHGLSYTEFAYSGLVCDQQTTTNGVASLRFTVQNTGTRVGDEVAQVYVSRAGGSAIHPNRQLAAFARVSLAPGEIKHVEVQIDLRQLAFHTSDLRLLVEPGTLCFHIGASCEDIRLEGKTEVVGDCIEIERRVFHAQVKIH